ncbi:dirigent protein 19-like [Cornus florida]|uniref:dirigent protein 19-like n=1 Tax=Cornus florida TaxID=4283 RepID=UPI00289F4999|nr:dirigent protein 19-like [Cornus florida]
MENLPFILLVCLMFIAMPVVRGGTTKGPKEVEEWFEKLSHAKEKVTKLRFYFHDAIKGKSPTAMPVAQANITYTSPTLFGLVNMMDDPLTVGPELSSKLLGRFQGLYGYVSNAEVGLLVVANFVFTDGEYNGSTLAVLGYNPILHHYREMPIVGGSGIFRLARGVVTVKNYFYNANASNATVEVNVVAVHY